MGTLLRGAIALVVGGGLGAATILGIVASQSGQGTPPASGVEQAVINYGTSQ
ncbi:MAG: hypothetical protein ACTHOK_02550 [Nocardioidaceae bacterium]